MSTIEVHFFQIPPDEQSYFLQTHADHVARRPCAHRACGGVTTAIFVLHIRKNTAAICACSKHEAEIKTKVFGKPVGEA